MINSLITQKTNARISHLWACFAHSPTQTSPTLIVIPQPATVTTPPCSNFQESRRESEVITRDITEYFNKTPRTKLKYSPPPPDPTTKSNNNRLVVAPSATNTTTTSTTRTNNNNNRYQQMLKMFGGGLKLKERLVLGASIAAVLVTFMLVVDLQMDLGMTGQHVIPSHGRVRYVSQEDGPGEAYNSFRKRFLQKTRRWVLFF